MNSNGNGGGVIRKYLSILIRVIIDDDNSYKIVRLVETFGAYFIFYYWTVCQWWNFFVRCWWYWVGGITCVWYKVFCLIFFFFFFPLVLLPTLVHITGSHFTLPICYISLFFSNHLTFYFVYMKSYRPCFKDSLILLFILLLLLLPLSECFLYKPLEFWRGPKIKHSFSFF